MQKFAFCWGSAADPIGGALSPDGDLTVFTGPTTKGTEGKGSRGGKEKRGEKGKVKGKEGRRGEGFCPRKNFGVAPPMLSRAARRTVTLSGADFEACACGLGHGQTLLTCWQV